MKKIMVMLGAVALAAGVQAASVNWQMQTAYKQYYVLNGDMSTAAITALSNTETGGAAAFSAWYATVSSDLKASGSATNRGASGKFLDNAADYLTFIVLESTLADGNKYAISVQSTEGHTYTTDTPPGAVAFAASSYASTIAEQELPPGPIPPVVPEPTSAMLLLLGVAGLALKRKQA